MPQCPISCDASDPLGRLGFLTLEIRRCYHCYGKFLSKLCLIFEPTGVSTQSLDSKILWRTYHPQRLLLRTYFMFFFYFLHKHDFIFFLKLRIYIYFYLKTFVIYWIGPKNHRIMLICELMFSLDSEWTNKIILPDNSVCFVLAHGYLGNTGNFTIPSKGNVFKNVFHVFNIWYKTCFSVFFIFSDRCDYNYALN